MSITLGALTNKTEISGDEKIPVSGPGTPSITPVLLGTWIQKVTVVAVEYGSASNQASVIQAAVNAAVSGDVLYFGEGVVKIETTISVTAKNVSVIANGTTFQTVSNIPIWTFDDADGFFFRGGNFIGVGKASGNNNEKGLYILNTNAFRVIGCTFTDFGLYGMHIGTAGGTDFVPSVIESTIAINCLNGIFLGSSATYMSFVASGANNCTTGWRITSGNNTLSACFASDCATGVLVTTGSNSGKLMVSGGQFNHNTTAGMNIDDTDGTSNNAVFFNGVAMLANSALVVNDDRVYFIGCDVEASNITLNSKYARFNTCHVHGTPTVTGGTNTSWVNCWNDSNTAFTG